VNFVFTPSPLVARGRRKISAWMSAGTMERLSGWLVATVSAIYLVTVCILASTKQFWNDELFTFYISRRPSLPEVWNALLTGAEQIPPLFYVITRASTKLFGHGYLAFRLPEILGFWIMGLSLFFFVRKRSSAEYGVLAMVIPLSTESFTYSYEARPYGLLLGFAGLALLFWQTAIEGPRRGIALAGLSLSLGAAISCHYYAILVFVPFLIGEAVRAAIRKRLDFPMLISIAAGLVPLGVFLPLIQAAHRYSDTFWAKPQWTNTLGFYSYLLFPALLVLACIPIVIAAGYVLAGSGREVPFVSLNPIPGHEIAAALGFILIPFVAVFLAKTVTGAFTNRYAVPAVIGVSILLTWSISVLSHRKPGPGLMITVITVALFLLTGVKSYRGWRESAGRSEETLRYLRTQGKGGVPVVVADPHLFFELSNLAGDKTPSPLIYLADKKLALQYTSTDDVDLGLVNLQQWAPLHVEDFHRFCSGHQEFLIYGSGAPYSWITQELAREEWQFILRSPNSGLLLAKNPQSQRAMEAVPTARSTRE